MAQYLLDTNVLLRAAAPKSVHHAAAVVVIVRPFTGVAAKRSSARHSCRVRQAERYLSLLRCTVLVSPVHRAPAASRAGAA